MSFLDAAAFLSSLRTLLWALAMTDEASAGTPTAARSAGSMKYNVTAARAAVTLRLPLRAFALWWGGVVVWGAAQFLFQKRVDW